MKKLLTTLLFLSGTLITWAQEVIIDHVHYSVNDEGTEAYVLGVDQGSEEWVVYPDVLNVLSSVTIEGREYAVTRIGREGLHWFYNAIPPKVINIPEGIKTIDGWAIGCLGHTFEKITLPSTITNLSGQAIEGHVESISIAEGNPVYDTRDNCNGIIRTADDCMISIYQSTVIPNSVRSIGPRSIREDLETLRLSAGISDFDNSCTTDCKFQYITVDEANPYFYVKDNCLIKKGSNILVTVGASAIKVADEVQVFGYLSLGNFSGSIIHYNEEYPLVPKYNPTGWRTTLSVPEGSIPRYMYSGWCRTEGPLFKAITDGISTFQLINESDTWFAPHVDMLSAKAGDEVELSVVLDADQSVTGFQFDLYLPDGIEVTTDDDGYEDIYLSTKRTTERRHTFTSQQQPDGSWRVLCYSNSNYSFNGNEGEVCIINVKIGDNLAENSYPIIFKNVVTSYLNGEGNTEQSQRDQLKTYINLWPEPEPYVNKMGSGDATNDGVVNVTDITAIVSYILGNNPTGFDFWQADAYQDEAINVTDIAATVNIIMNDSSPQQAPKRMARRNVRKFADKSTTASLEVIPFAITPGEEKEVEVILNNPDNAFTGLQFDLTLPEGINLASDEDGYLVNLGSRTTSRKHTIEAQQRADGAIRVMAYSNRNSNFSGSEGDVVILTLKADNDLAGGIYNLQMKDIVLSQANGDEINQIVPANYEGSILSGTLAENPIIKGDITVEAAALIASAVSEAVTSIDLTNAVAVAKDAVFTTANPNTLIRVAEEIQVNTQNVISGQTCANLVLTDKNAYAAPCAFTALQASFNANVNSYKTLTLPFDAPVPEGISASNATSVTGTRVNLKSTSTISANNPVLIQGDGSIEISATNVAVVATDGTALTNGVLCGTYKNILAPIGCYVLQKQNGVMRFCHVEDGQPVVGAFRAYLNVPESNVQVYTFDEDDATSIASLPEDTEESVTVYNIAGQHISKVQKGINIINGKKILK